MQRALRERAMRAGATMIAPETVFLSYDTVLGRDVMIEPHVVFGPGVSVADGAVIHAFSHLQGARVASGAALACPAAARGGGRAKAKVGNFVEIKKARLEAGAKVNHLSYIGDARVGAGANIGAGTITCNYDGFGKAKTEIGAGAFIGSNSALVAPVTVGEARCRRGLGDHQGCARTRSLSRAASRRRSRAGWDRFVLRAQSEQRRSDRRGHNQPRAVVRGKSLIVRARRTSL